MFKGLPETRRNALSRKVTGNFTPRRILLHRPDAKVTGLAFFAPLPPDRLGTNPVEELLLLDLGVDSQSVLLNAVRDRVDASYDFIGSAVSFTNKNHILIMGGLVEPSRLAEVERVVRESYASFRAAGPRLLEDRKNQLKAKIAEIASSPVTLARMELKNALDGFPPGRSLRLTSEVDAVTQKMVMTRLQQAFPAPDAFTVIAVSPDAKVLPGACVVKTPREAANCR